MKTASIITLGLCVLMSKAQAEIHFSRGQFSEARWATLEPIRQAVLAADPKPTGSPSIRLFLVFELADNNSPQGLSA